MGLVRLGRARSAISQQEARDRIAVPACQVSSPGTGQHSREAGGASPGNWRGGGSCCGRVIPANCSRQERAALRCRLFSCFIATKATVQMEMGIKPAGKFTATVQDGTHPLTGIVIEDKSTHTYFFLTHDQYAGPSTGSQGLGKHGNGKVSSTGNVTTICFMAGTMIRPDGEVPIETLKRGDLVLTHDSRSVPMDWLGIQTISLRFADKMRVLPIRIRAGAIAENVPSRDLLVSPDHGLLVECALIQAGALVNGSSIVRERSVPHVFTYYHVELDDHSLILAENTPAETFVDNVDRLGFDNWAEHDALYPTGKHVKELPYPRAKSHRQVPVSIRVMLGARAQAGVARSRCVAPPSLDRCSRHGARSRALRLIARPRMRADRVAEWPRPRRASWRMPFRRTGTVKSSLPSLNSRARSGGPISWHASIRASIRPRLSSPPSCATVG
jgi:hypothetical protein